MPLTRRRKVIRPRRDHLAAKAALKRHFHAAALYISLAVWLSAVGKQYPAPNLPGIFTFR